MGELKIKYVNINDLHEYKNNPRINDKAVPAVAASIKKFGFKNPIIIDKDNTIICGHTRLKSAKKLKLESVPCVVADDLTEEEIKAFRLADNQVASLASYDIAKLDFEMQGIENIDMRQFGFSLDFDSLDINDAQIDTHKAKENKMIIGNTTIPLTDDELESMNALIDKYVAENGVVFGFARWILCNMSI